MISKNNKPLKASVAVVLALGSFATSAMAEDFRMLASWDSSYPIVPQVADVFAEMVSEASGGDSTIALTGPEAVPPFEQQRKRDQHSPFPYRARHHRRQSFLLGSSAAIRRRRQRKRVPDRSRPARVHKAEGRGARGGITGMRHRLGEFPPAGKPECLCPAAWSARCAVVPSAAAGQG